MVKVAKIIAIAVFLFTISNAAWAKEPVEPTPTPTVVIKGGSMNASIGKSSMSAGSPTSTPTSTAEIHTMYITPLPTQKPHEAAVFTERPRATLPPIGAFMKLEYREITSTSTAQTYEITPPPTRTPITTRAPQALPTQKPYVGSAASCITITTNTPTPTPTATPTAQ